MGRESRHLWVGNIPDNASETDVINYFTPFGEVDKMEFLTNKESSTGVTAVVSFLSLQIAAKIHKMSHKMTNNALSMRFHDFSSLNVADPKAEPVVKTEPEHFHRKRSPSPVRGGIKRKIEVGRNDNDNPPGFDVRKRVIVCHSLPEGHSVHAITSGLYQEFKQIGKIKQLWVNVDRGVQNAVVMYHDSQVAHMAYEELNRKIQFGKPLDLELLKDRDAYTHYPDTSNTGPPVRDKRPPPAAAGREVIPPRSFEHRLGRRQEEDVVTDEGASTTLFVGNLSGNVRYRDLMQLFKRYGDIECIDIKESDKGYPYAFIRYYDLKSACAAKKYLNEEILYDRLMKIGYGKGCQTNTVMAMEIDRNCPEAKVEAEFSKFGELVRMTYNPTLGSCLCTYADTESAQIAIENMRGRCLGRTGRVKVDFANHEECQEFYNNYERCKASQQLMKYQMEMLTAETERESRKKYEDFRVEERRLSYDQKYSPNRRDSRNTAPVYSSNKRYERVSRDVRDLTPSPPRGRAVSPQPRGRTSNASPRGRTSNVSPRARNNLSPARGRNTNLSPRGRNSNISPVDRRPMGRPNYENDWKGKGKAANKHNDESRRRPTVQRVSSRYNSEERQLARHIRDSRNSRERSGDRAEFQPSNVKRIKKSRSERSPSPVNKNRRSKEGSYKASSGRGTSSLMDNDWNKKYDKDEKRRGSRASSPRSRREDDREKRKKEKRTALSEEEEEILNSLIAMRREEKSRQKNTRREPDRDDRRKKTNERRSDRSSDKRKRKSKQESSDDTSDDSSSCTSSGSSEIDVGEQDEEPAVPDSALDRIAKIISDSTNGQVQLNTGGAVGGGAADRYSPLQEKVKQETVPPAPTLIPIPPAAHQPLLNPPVVPQPPQQQQHQQQSKELLSLLRKYPIMWNGCLALKNDTADVQLHFLSGSSLIAEGAIKALPNLGPGPMRIAQRMRLEPNQIEGVQKRMQHEGQWCMMLGLPHGTDPVSVSTQTTTLQQGFISYLESKQAAGIINLPVPDQSPFVLHIFPPCQFTHQHMTTFCPELIEGAGDCGYLLIVIATVS